MAYCTNCGTKLEEGWVFCIECGAIIEAATDRENPDPVPCSTKACNKCGAKMPGDAFYCLNCGNTFDDPYYDFKSVQNRINHQFGAWKSKRVALLLCIFLGWIGAHKYYEGKVGMGLLYTFTVGLFLFGWLIDAIILIFKPNPYRVR